MSHKSLGLEEAEVLKLVEIQIMTFWIAINWGAKEQLTLYISCNRVKEHTDLACLLYVETFTESPWMVGNCTLLGSILVMNGAVISRLRHGIFGYYGHAEMPAAGYPGHSFDDKLRGRSVSWHFCVTKLVVCNKIRSHIRVWRTTQVMDDCLLKHVLICPV